MKKILLAAAISAFAFINVQAQVSNQGLKSSYPLNGNFDDTYASLNGDALNSPVSATNRAQVIDAAMSFDGIASYAIIPFNQDGLTKTFNIWFNADNIFSDIGTILSMDNGQLENGLVLLAVQRQNNVDRLLMSAGDASSTYSIPNLKNAWHMLTISINDNLATHYIDGDSIGTNVNQKIHSADGILGITLAASRAGFNRFFDGRLDDLRVYDIALTSAEVKSLYQNTLTNTFVASTTNTLGSVVVYPNPAEQELNYKYTSSHAAQTLKVLNTLGQVVMNGNVTLTEGTISTSSLSTGIYFLQLLDASSRVIAIEKFMVK